MKGKKLSGHFSKSFNEIWPYFIDNYLIGEVDKNISIIS